jgi:bacillithiol system protein YtxJ
MDIMNLTDMKDWQLMWDEQKAEDAGGLFIFKLSPICPTSITAEDEIYRFAAAMPPSKDLKLAKVDVINCRPIAQRIAADTKVRHESPQAILVSRGQTILWNASHDEITEESLAEALTVAKL